MSVQRCDRCRGEHNDEVGFARCALEHATVDALLVYAKALDTPATVTQVRDLWAHARTMRDDGQQAARWARVVLDLGWRPTVGPGTKGP